MYEGGTPIEKNELPDKFAKYFSSKITVLSDMLPVNTKVYNGTKKLEQGNKMFMDKVSIMECILSLQVKNSEGYDRIPQRILVDGADVLIATFEGLFSRIYTQVRVPDQWLVSKTIPVYKNKGDKKDVENYRPISNLCSSSKIFEKLILKRILEIQDDQNVDITGNSQHGFKKNRSTASLSLTIQTIISQALELGWKMTAMQLWQAWT